MDTPKTKCRLYVTAPLGEGLAVTVEASQAHYLRNVMRTVPGDRVTLFNGHDGEWAATIESVTKSAARMMPDALIRRQERGCDLTLAFAPVKKTALDTIVTKATELGVARLIPVFTDHCDVTRINRARIESNICEAAEQCERLDLPVVTDAVGFDNLMASWTRSTPLLACLERNTAPSLVRVAERTDPPCGLLIGPEGGFSKRELDLMADLPFVHGVSLGPRILRADTAAIVALTIWQAAAGDLR